ncbi:DUF1127 domain-containing protein [Bradyrhizobium sp. USDA 4486]
MSILLTAPGGDPARASAGPGHPASSIQLRNQISRSAAGMVELARPAARTQSLREIVDDPHMLKDLGLTREQALCEAAKPFWLWFLL